MRYAGQFLPNPRGQKRGIGILASVRHASTSRTPTCGPFHSPGTYSGAGTPSSGDQLSIVSLPVNSRATLFTCLVCYFLLATRFRSKACFARRLWCAVVIRHARRLWFAVYLRHACLFGFLIVTDTLAALVGYMNLARFPKVVVYRFLARLHFRLSTFYDTLPLLVVSLLGHARSCHWFAIPIGTLISVVCFSRWLASDIGFLKPSAR